MPPEGIIIVENGIECQSKKRDSSLPLKMTPHPASPVKGEEEQN
jgi:hypothetical protein